MPTPRAGRWPLSPSRARVWAECRWRYRELYVRGVTVLPDPALRLGALAHAAIHAYVTWLLERRLERATEAEVEACFTAWAEATPEPIAEGQWLELLDLLRRFARGYRLDWDHVWRAEVGLAVDAAGQPVEFDDRQRAWLRGRADLVLVDGRLGRGRIQDWKTARAALSEGELARDLQARTYALLLSRWNDGLDEVWVEFYYPRLGSWRRARFGPHEWRETWEEWRSLDAALRAALARPEDDRLWAPTPGWHCAGCPVALACPLGMSEIGLALGVPVRPEDRERLAELLLVLEAKRQAIRQGLRAAVERQGPFEHRGVRFDLYPAPRWEWDLARVAALCRQHAVEPASVMDVSLDRLRQLRRREPALVQALEAEARRDVGGVTFGYRRAGSAEETAGPAAG